MSNESEQVMTPAERTIWTRFDAIMSRFDAEERRALADLRSLGFHVQGIPGARRIQVEQYKNTKRSN